MNEIIETQISGTNMGTVEIAIGAAIATAQPNWQEPIQNYTIERTQPTYSAIAEQVLAAVRNPHGDFVSRITAIYSSLSERQQLLGAEFEAAIYDDLDSLYEA